MSIDKGILHIVATPIGNLQDFSPRGARVLAEVDLVLVEDTRTSGRLMQKFNITTRMQAFHEHNERELGSAILKRLVEGENIALISDAGTPLISDPGFHLVRQAHVAGISVITVPGPCAAIAALAASGIPSDRFIFEGFLPSRRSARCQVLEDLSHERRTLVFYESPHRIMKCIEDIVDVLGETRLMTLARELTKIHETVNSGTASHILNWMRDDPDQTRGEFVIVISGAGDEREESGNERQVLEILLRYLPVSAAVAAATDITGAGKNKLYQLALELKDGSSS